MNEARGVKRKRKREKKSECVDGIACVIPSILKYTARRRYSPGVLYSSLTL